jgi:transposase
VKVCEVWYKEAKFGWPPAKEGIMATVSPTYQLSDEQWRQIEDLLPDNGQRGGQWKDHRLMIDAILWVLSDGGRWRNIPERFGPWQSVYDRFRKWCRAGLWDRILRRLQARKMADDDIDWGFFAIDGTIVRAHQSAAGASQKKDRRESLWTTPWDAAKEALAPSCT